MSENQNKLDQSLLCQEKKCCISVAVVDWRGVKLGTLQAKTGEIIFTPKQAQGAEADLYIDYTLYGVKTEDQHSELNNDNKQDDLPSFIKYTLGKLQPGYLKLKTASEEHDQQMRALMERICLPLYSFSDIDIKNGTQVAAPKIEAGDPVLKRAQLGWESPAQRFARGNKVWFHLVRFVPDDPEDDRDNSPGYFAITSWPPGSAQGGAQYYSESRLGSFMLRLLVDGKDMEKRTCTKHVVELEGRYCYIPILKYNINDPNAVNGYNGINAYNLGLFSALAYSEYDKNEDGPEIGSVKDVLGKMRRLELPKQVNTTPSPLLVEPVPWYLRYRYQKPEEAYAEYDKTGSSCLMLHNPHNVILCLRGIRKEAYSQVGHKDFITAQAAMPEIFKHGDTSFIPEYVQTNLQEGIQVAKVLGSPSHPWIKFAEDVDFLITIVKEAEKHFNYDAKVHGKYLEALLGIQEAISMYLGKYGGKDKNKNIYIMGHCTGGMLATLLHLWLIEKKKTASLLYTYADPPVRQRLYKLGQTYSKLPHYRHRNYDDPVPHLVEYYKDPSWWERFKRAADAYGSGVQSLAEALELPSKDEVQKAAFWSTLNAMIELGERDDEMAYKHDGANLLYTKEGAVYISQCKLSILDSIAEHCKEVEDHPKNMLFENIQELAKKSTTQHSITKYIENAKKPIEEWCNFALNKGNSYNAPYLSEQKRVSIYQADIKNQLALAIKAFEKSKEGGGLGDQTISGLVTESTRSEEDLASINSFGCFKSIVELHNETGLQLKGILMWRSIKRQLE